MSAPDLQNNSKAESVWSKIKNVRIGGVQLFVAAIIFWLLLTWLACSMEM